MLRTTRNSELYFVKTNADDSLIVFSPTHPSAQNWYRNPVVLFSSVPKNISSVKIWDTLVPDVPIQQFKNVESPFTYKVPGDGVYRFEFDDGSGILFNYRVSIDTTPPNQLRLRFSDTAITVGDIVRIDVRGGQTTEAGFSELLT